MDPAARLLRLLTTLSARPWWNADELAEREGVTVRTVRRDVARLRELGYPIKSTTGPYGRYELGAGGRLPPLLIDDDEAVAIAIALRVTAGGLGSGLADAALAALTKLEQVMPPTVRHEVEGLHQVTVGLPGSDGPTIDPGALVTLALACRREEAMRMTYTDAQGRTSERLVEPYRLVHAFRRWYLVALDRTRDDWRTLRVDRMSSVRSSGIRFATHVDPPDAARLVAQAASMRADDISALIRLAVPNDPDRVPVPPNVGLVEGGDKLSTLVRINGSVSWIARYLAGLECDFEVLEPRELRAELRRIGRHLSRQHREPKT